MKRYYRIKDFRWSLKAGKVVYLADDMESPTDDPRYALVTSEPDWFIDNFDCFEAEPLPEDQQMLRNGQPRLL